MVEQALIRIHRRDSNVSKRFEGKVVLVTGAGSGIGEATAIRAAEEGAAVVLCARREEQLQRVANIIEAAGGKALVKPLDVSDEARFNAVVEETVNELGRIDVLINNAMVMEASMLESTTTESWRNNFTVTLDGTFFGIRAVLPYMQKQKGGSIVNISSICGMLATPGTAGYSSAKAGMLALSRNTAIEGAPYNIRSNVISPGVVMTPATEGAIPDEEGQAFTASTVPLKRIADPKELASAILFLASDDASYITGVNLPVDGGRTCELFVGAADFSE